MLGGQELAKELEGSWARRSEAARGVERSLGPGPSRPVIRGLDGDRVLVVQNSRRTATCPVSPATTV